VPLIPVVSNGGLTDALLASALFIWVLVAARKAINNGEGDRYCWRVAEILNVLNWLAQKEDH